MTYNLSKCVFPNEIDIVIEERIHFDYNVSNATNVIFYYSNNSSQNQPTFSMYFHWYLPKNLARHRVQ